MAWRDVPTFGSLFAGIGGIDLGLERAGWDCRFQVEWDPFCQRVLAKHWPDVPRYGDIADVHGPLAHAEGRARLGPASRQDGHAPLGHQSCSDCLPAVDLLAGGFPCQPFSVAGAQRRLADDRWLWPEFERVIRQLRPRYVLVENVPGLLVGGGMDAVLGGLAGLGYDAEWESIPAAAVGAPHLRYRVWIVAHANGKRGGWGATGPREASGGRSHDPTAGRGGILAHANGASPQGRGVPSGVHPEHAHADGRGGNGERVLAHATGGRQPRPGEPLDAVHPTATADGQAAEPFDGGFADQWSVEPDVGRVAHGVPARVDRLRSLGNAVVPQVVEWIGRRMIDDYYRG